jgi:1-acyl-sn-glycerol-3-phosphate acyltransferase
MRVRILNKSSLRLPGGFILACTHLSHLEPLVASVVCPRRIDWMARSEFFRSRILTILLRIVDSFSVQREGVAIKAFRTALDRLRRGRIVGVFPEGLVSPGINSACRGGAIKLGACAIAIRAAVPIIPCIILGTDQLNSIRPWLPTKSGRLYLAFGDPIYPPAISSAISAGPLRRKARMEMGNQLARSYVDLYANALKTFELEERDIP